MKKYRYDILISAQNESEAEKKKKALEKLSGQLTATELTKLTDVIENDPIKKEIAKKALGV